MASQAVARADLEALLRARKLDRTVTRADLPGQGAVATGIALLDAALGGGFPRGEMSEVSGPRSSGRSSVLAAALGAATTAAADGTALAALVDPLDMFDPESGAKAGIGLPHLLWVRGDAISRHADAPPRPRAFPARHLSSPGAERLAAADAWARALDRGVKALNLVLQAGGFDLVALDIAEVPADAIRRLPFTTWFRLQRTIEGSRTACLVVGPTPIARSAGGVTVELSRVPESGDGWSGTRGHPRRFVGLDIQARLVRSREGGAEACQFAARW